MVAAALTVLVMVAVLLVTDHRYLWLGDTTAAYYGWWYHLGDLVRHGQWPPTIDPHAWRAGGLAAEGQWGVWSPLTVAIGLLASGSSHLLVVNDVVKAGLAVVAALGAFRLVRSYDAPPAAAYVAAVAVPMGGMTQYLDLPSWAAGRDDLGTPAVGLVGAAPHDAPRRQPAARARARLPAGDRRLRLRHDHAGRRSWSPACSSACSAATGARSAGSWSPGCCSDWSPLTVYLPGVLTASVTSRNEGFGGFGGKFTTDPLALLASVLPTAAVPGTTSHLMPLRLPGLVPAGRAVARLGTGAPRVATARWSAPLHRGDPRSSSTGPPSSGRCGGRSASSRSS